MKLKSASGLTLVELVVVVGVLALFFAAMLPSISSSARRAHLVTVVSRGQTIFVAIEGANTERKPLGMPLVWPCDFDPSVVTNDEERALLGVSNSTDFFRVLYDEDRVGTSNHSPYVVGFDYSKLAGAGVRVCNSQKLTAANNMWTVAKNVRDDMDEVVPVLITRNIDALSLAARVGERDLKKKTLRFDPCWPTPLGDKDFVLIRKGGATFKARAKHMGYKVVYQNRVFDTALTTNGMALPPLKYLTPTREVTPSAQAYAEGAEIAYRQAGGRMGLVKREIRKRVTVLTNICPFLVFLSIAYVFRAAFALRHKSGIPESRGFPADWPAFGVLFCGYLAMVGYVAGLVGARDDCGVEFLLAALLAQSAGIGLALAFQRKNPAARRRQVKWMLAPLWIVLGLAFLFGAFDAIS